MRSNLPRNLDLNLLHAFSVLMEERNVSRAAERLFIGQPGLSSALRRLREALDDELFVRVGRGLQPTPRALAIAPEIAKALATIERAVRAPQAFDPSNWQGEFRVGMCDSFEMAFMGQLAARLRTLAPRARVVAVAASKRDRVALLEQGAYDFSVAVHDEPASWHVREALFDEQMVCLHDPAQLAIPEVMPLETYARAQHVIVSSDGNDTTVLDNHLQAAGINRNVIVGVSRYAAVAPLLKAVPAIATVPQTVAHCMARLYGLKVTVPLMEFPAEPTSLLYRRVDEADPRNAWFRSQFATVVAEAVAESSCRSAVIDQRLAYLRKADAQASQDDMACVIAASTVA